ncbi:MAG: ElyC/SanA/YdcF family protein [Candidatus Eremiobacterota bacterium]
MRIRFTTRRVLRLGLMGLGLGILAVAGANLLVVGMAARHTVAVEQVRPAQAAIVLGAGVYPGGSLSGVLRDRMNTGIELYQAGKVQRLLLSGDHGQNNYDEVNSMRVYAERRGVPVAHIFLDHAGFSTYETMVRARRIFEVESAVVVTNRFHLARAVFLARSVGIEAQGVAAGHGSYAGQEYLEQREVLARCKDLLNAWVLRPEPTLSGPPVPITGDARLSHDNREPTNQRDR